MKSLWLLTIVLSCLSFRIELNCTFFTSFVQNHDHVIIYHNYSEARSLLNNCSQYADPNTLVVLCADYEVPFVVAEDKLPAYVFSASEASEDIKIIPSFGMDDFLKFGNLISPLSQYKQHNKSDTPFILLMLNLSADYDFFMEYDRLARMKVFKFEHYYYVDTNEKHSTPFDEHQSPSLLIISDDAKPLVHELKRTRSDAMEIVQLLKPYEIEHAQESEREYKNIAEFTVGEDGQIKEKQNYLPVLIIGIVVSIVILICFINKGKRHAG